MESSNIITVVVIDKIEKLKHFETSYLNNDALSAVLYEDTYCPGHFWLEVNHSSANKGAAIEKLKSHLKIQKVISFGDNQNDIPMFKVSHHSLAVKNANTTVKNSAHEVIGENNDDAVVNYLSNLSSF